VVSGTLPVPVGIGRVPGAAVAPGRVVAVAAVVTVGTGLVVDESTRAGSDPQPARTPISATASAATTTERRPGNTAPRALYPGFPPEPLSSPP
jgi:hypothetical protein